MMDNYSMDNRVFDAAGGKPLAASNTSAMGERVIG
jgi:hypothetical protein